MNEPCNWLTIGWTFNFVSRSRCKRSIKCFYCSRRSSSQSISSFGNRGATWMQWTRFSIGLTKISKIYSPVLWAVNLVLNSYCSSIDGTIISQTSSRNSWIMWRQSTPYRSINSKSHWLIWFNNNFKSTKIKSDTGNLQIINSSCSKHALFKKRCNFLTWKLKHFSKIFRPTKTIK